MGWPHRQLGEAQRWPLSQLGEPRSHLGNLGASWEAQGRRKGEKSLSGDSNGQRYPCPALIFRVFSSKLKQGKGPKGYDVLQNTGEFPMGRGGAFVRVVHRL